MFFFRRAKLIVFGYFVFYTVFQKVFFIILNNYECEVSTDINQIRHTTSLGNLLQIDFNFVHIALTVTLCLVKYASLTPVVYNMPVRPVVHV